MAPDTKTTFNATTAAKAKTKAKTLFMIPKKKKKRQFGQKKKKDSNKEKLLKHIKKREEQKTSFDTRIAGKSTSVGDKSHFQKYTLSK